jgi:hypothetical protein
VNPRYRIYAAVGGGLALLLLIAFFVLGRGNSAPAAAPAAIKPLHAVKKTATAKAKAAARATAKKRTLVTAKATAKAKPAAKATLPLAPPKVAKTNGAVDGMPAGLSAALKTHSVVVVSLVVPDAPVDQMALAEAKAGAAQAGAGFVRIDASSNDDVQALATLIGTNSQPDDRLLDSPAVLVFRQPHDLYVRINGYVDADTIAQAATNAAPLAPVQSGNGELASAWVAGANAFCNKLRLELLTKPLPTNANDALDYMQSLLTTMKAEIDKIRALKPPAGRAARVHAMLAAYDRAFADANGSIAAIRHKDVATFQRLSSRIKAEGDQGDAIAAELGATACSGNNG